MAGQGAVTVVTMTAPVAMSLLLLARLVAQHAMRWAQLAAARLRTLERLELLNQGLAPSLPQASVRVRPPMLKFGPQWPKQRPSTEAAVQSAVRVSAGRPRAPRVQQDSRAANACAAAPDRARQGGLHRGSRG